MNLDSNPKRMINYSIIIPHKNSVNLLRRCLFSIPQREDVQIIVVDDNSNRDVDNLKEVVSQFPCTELVLTSEGGAGHARNIGLKYVKGKWILFADADDFFHQNFLEELDKYLETQVDIVFFDTDSCYSKNLKSCETRIYEISEGIKNRDIEYLKWKVYVVWGKLFNANLIQENNLRFDEVIASNDVTFACMASYYARNVRIDSFILYCSTVNLNSLCYKMSRENIDARVDVALRFNRFVHSIGKGKYQINLFSILLFYKQLSFMLFMEKLLFYLRKISITMLLQDFKLSLNGFKRLLLGKNKLRKQVTMQTKV